MEKNQKAALLSDTATSTPAHQAVPVLPSVAPLTVRNAEFVTAIFGNLPEATVALICTKPSDPTVGGWPTMQADDVDTKCPPKNNNYLNCSSFYCDVDGTANARKDCFAAYHCLVLDDVGTKVSRECLADFKPSWEIETSPDNYQVGIILRRPLIDSKEVANLQSAVKAAKLCDPGASGPVRWVRLPVGINGKPKYASHNGRPFECRLTLWNPKNRYTVEEIAFELKLEMSPVMLSGSVVNASLKTVTRFASADDLVVSDQLLSKRRSASPALIAALLKRIDPGCDYGQWSRVLMAVFHETEGSNDGLTMADEWSSQGANYKNVNDVEGHWRSFRHDIAKPVTIGTLIKMAKDAGADTDAILRQFDNDEFEVCSSTIIDARSGTSVEKPGADVQPHSTYPLEKYYLRDIGKIEREAMEQKLILGNLVLLGQATVIYAKQNTGKTLITLSLIVSGIKEGRFDASKLVYVNMDDDTNGLAIKARLAEEFGFQMVADGHQGFVASALPKAVVEMIATDTARGYIIVLDTLKKFVNTMNKEQSTGFSKIIRQFVLKGGTVIALAHTNKNPGIDGKDVYAGTTDIIDDFDCGYILKSVSMTADRDVKTVEFENIKRRGNVALKAAYTYAVEPNISYNELLLTVQEVGENQFELIKKAAAVQSDAAVINAVIACIKKGITSKMKLVTATAEQARVPRRAALKIIEKYTGHDPTAHRWSFEVRERGAKVFVLPGHPPAATTDPAAHTP